MSFEPEVPALPARTAAAVTPQVIVLAAPGAPVVKKAGAPWMALTEVASVVAKLSSCAR